MLPYSYMDKGKQHQMQSKIKSYEKKREIEAFKSDIKKVLTGGCFDLLHYGHLNFLKSAKAYGDVLIVALESDESILKMKGALPIHTQQQRAQILAELSCVDFVLLLPSLSGFEDYMDLVRCVSPQILAVTNGDKQTANKAKQADFIGAKLVVVNQLIEGLSSSIIRSKL